MLKWLLKIFELYFYDSVKYAKKNLRTVSYSLCVKINTIAALSVYRSGFKMRE